MKLAPTPDMPAYYARRAGEYEAIYAKPERQADLRAIEAALPAEFTGRRVLELACGTGWWTAHGARDAGRWLATDLIPEPLTIARSKQMPACVQFAIGDAYDLPLGDFDAVFAGLWWSHVLKQRLPGWLQDLHARLPAGASLVFLDNLFVPGSSTPLSRRDEAGNTYQQRRLDDGSWHEVLKNFPQPEDAIAVLGPRAVDARWVAHARYWVLSYALA